MVSGLVAHPVRIGKIALQPFSCCEPRCSGLSRRLAKIVSDIQCWESRQVRRYKMVMQAMSRYAIPD